MTTEKQAAANRENARHSTGPRTEAGKTVASQNARTHGLLSREVLLPAEDAETLAALRECLTTQFEPDGELERLLVDRIVSCMWRLRRVQAAEVGALELYVPTESNPSLNRNVSLRSGLGRAFWDQRGADGLSKLSRYETAIERSFFQALHELQRLQAARVGKEVAPPVAIDVTITPPEIKVDA